MPADRGMQADGGSDGSHLRRDVRWGDLRFGQGVARTAHASIPGCAPACTGTQVCNGTTCIDNACATVTCPGAFQVCDPVTGQCGNDPCTACGLSCGSRCARRASASPDRPARVGHPAARAQLAQAGTGRHGGYCGRIGWLGRSGWHGRNLGGGREWKRADLRPRAPRTSGLRRVVVVVRSKAAMWPGVRRWHRCGSVRSR